MLSKMATKTKVVRNAAVGLTAAVLLAGEAAEKYEDAKRVAYVTQNLRKLMPPGSSGNDNSSNPIEPKERQQLQQPLDIDGEATATTAGTNTAWLAKDTPKFPYLLGISPGDNPAKVIHAYVRVSLFRRDHFW